MNLIRQENAALLIPWNAVGRLLEIICVRAVFGPILVSWESLFGAIFVKNGARGDAQLARKLVIPRLERIATRPHKT